VCAGFAAPSRRHECASGIGLWVSSGLRGQKGKWKPAGNLSLTRSWPQCTSVDPGAALRPQTAHSFDCLDAASPSRIHSSACLRSISRAKGSSVCSAAWRQSLAWCSHNSTCDDIGPTSCGHLMPARAHVAAVPAGVHRCYQPVGHTERRLRSRQVINVSS
jgi:hypothetical protein